MSRSSGVVLAVDQGTSSTKAVAVDASGEIVASHVVPVGQRAPRAGWIEQDPEELLASVLRAAQLLTSDLTARDLPPEVLAVGLSNQRESALVWETATGEPLGPLLGWQDRRTLERARQLSRSGAGRRVRQLSGLPLDPMFSALKISWLLDEVDPQRTQARTGALTVGTLDAWLLQRLTGERRIEAGNASRTQLLDVRRGQWSEELLDLFDVPRAALPEVVPSDETSAPVGAGAALAGARISGVLGDSHAALFAHGVRTTGSVKATYGTGSSIMGLTHEPVAADSGLVETVAWRRGDAVSRAFEGNILSTGATLLWLGDILGCTTAELSDLARSVPDNGGVSLVPAFSGLGAPWWDEEASSVITGFGPGNGRAHLARAAFESIALQVEDVLEHADAAGGGRIHTVLTDGGPSRNDWLMQLQADVSSRRVQRSDVAQLSVTGAAHLAGLSRGVWSEQDVAALPRPQTPFSPAPHGGPGRARTQWRAALSRSRAAV